jgi:hypothetical protein
LDEVDLSAVDDDLAVKSGRIPGALVKVRVTDEEERAAAPDQMPVDRLPRLEVHNDPPRLDHPPREQLRQHEADQYRRGQRGRYEG